MYQVRDTHTPFNLWGGFRDELITTGMTLTLVVIGSFVLVQKVFFPAKPTAVTPEPTPVVVAVLPSITPSPTVIPALAPKPASPSGMVAGVATEGAVVVSEVPFGEDGEYDFSSYNIKFKKPTIVFDAGTNTRRKLTIEVELTNKSVIEGLDSRLTASIVKDGVIIVPKAAMYIKDRQVVSPNQMAKFEATLTLVEATDVREIRFEPGGGLPVASHFLYQ